MPASLTRVCPACNIERRTPDDFRDPGEERKSGRPPRFCLACREANPDAARDYARNKSRRRENRWRARDLADRTAYEIESAMFAAHPLGLKTCPAVAGCGRDLELDRFSLSCHQTDGLNPVCRECDKARTDLRAERADG